MTKRTGVQDMSIADFIIAVFCLIDDELKKVLNGKRLRQRGPSPGLQDSEVITMEIVGEFLGKDCDKTIWEYFKGHWMHFFPKIPNRSNFVRQAANLHVVKRMLQEDLALNGLHLQTPLRDNMVDSRPQQFLGWMKGTRRLIETVIGQLAERFHIEKIRARDLWHEASRFWRKLLAHTVCVKLSIEQEHEPLQFERLVTV